MNGLVNKPHFDKGVFKPGTPIVVDIPRGPYRGSNSFYESCLVLEVNKDKLKILYVCKNEGEDGTFEATRVIEADDVANGTCKIKFMEIKKIESEEI